ncbi:hypothetical protein HYFRA_00013348 [Hymenoscyphus fraxineus]|uniref:Uncharacterized protein n=1 Tax=Hymenoscyphus fraxineus TaxID=746836 RepID=A0A9N9PZG1_9HELO|nr:hypothetical protein HYFRA_00013348 [Hymenoscyphus fraxineus]
MPKLHEFRDLEMASDMNVHAAPLHVQCSPSKDSSYESLVDDKCVQVESDMEGSAPQARPKKAPRVPALPARSDRRASSMLKDVMLELHNLDGSEGKDIEEVSVVEEKDPHELYLSSEEDASLSDFEDSESLVDFEPMEEAEIMEAELKAPGSRGSSRKSQEVTARAVSFTMVKPMIIDITPATNASPPRPTTSAFESSSRSRPQSYFGPKPVQIRSESPTRPAARRPSPLKLHTSSIRRMSISSFSSLTQSSSGSSSNLTTPITKQNDKRKSTRMANLASLVTHSLQHKPSSHSFLATDPYPTPEASPAFPPQEFRSDTPRTPTSAAAAAFKKGLTRSLHAARKPSLPKLSSFSHRNSSMLNLAPPPIAPIPEPPTRQRRKSLAFPTQASVPELAIPPMPLTPQMPLTPHTPLTYQGILKGAAPSPPAEKNESPPRKTKERRSILYMGRRKSLKA